MRVGQRVKFHGGDDYGWLTGTVRAVRPWPTPTSDAHARIDDGDPRVDDARSNGFRVSVWAASFEIDTSMQIDLVAQAQSAREMADAAQRRLDIAEARIRVATQTLADAMQERNVAFRDLSSAMQRESNAIRAQLSEVGRVGVTQ